MTNISVLPDGSAFCTKSFPLPKDHWLYAKKCEIWDDERDTFLDTPVPIFNNNIDIRSKIIEAIRFSFRRCTANGTDMDLDPDALVQNIVYALCGSQSKVTKV